MTTGITQNEYGNLAIIINWDQFFSDISWPIEKETEAETDLLSYTKLTLNMEFQDDKDGTSQSFLDSLVDFFSFGFYWWEKDFDTSQWRGSSE